MTLRTVAYVGNFQYGTWPAEARWSTEHQVALSLESMGHTVVRLQENSTPWDAVAWVAERCDMLLWTCTWSIDTPGAFACLERLRRAGVPSATLHLDLFWGLQNRRPDWIQEPSWKVDHVFTADGGHEAEWAAAGVNHHWMAPAIFGPDAVRGEVTEDYARFPIAFVGSHPYPHPEWAQQRRALINGLTMHFRGRFRVYNGGIRGRDLANLYASAKVIVGDSCLAGQVPRFWSDRIPETLGRGGFLLHPWVDGIDECYEDKTHLRLYEAGDLGQVCALVDHYLACPDEAREIADTGQALVRHRDTYERRMQTVFDTVFPSGPAIPHWSDVEAADHAAAITAAYAHRGDRP